MNNLNFDDYLIILIILLSITYAYYKEKLTETFLPTYLQNQYNYQKLFPLLPNYIDQRLYYLINYLERRDLEIRDRSVLNDPLVAPERRVELSQYPFSIKDVINTPTRGYPENYQLLGLASRQKDEKIVQLYGRPTFPNSNQYEYYILNEKNGFTTKIPIQYKNGKELSDGQKIHIPVLDPSKGEFEIKLYNYDTPRYNPYV
jgi:hypothetical protein